jgi:hypothetical protein
MDIHGTAGEIAAAGFPVPDILAWLAALFELILVACFVTGAYFSEAADQKRVVTPRRALDDGASILVIGRPITAAPDPAAAIRDINATLTSEVVP